MYNNGDLKRKDNTLQFTAYDGEKRDIPIERISDIYVMSEMSFNTTFLNYISQYGIPIHFFNYYNYYSGSFYPKDGNPAGQLLVKQVEHYVALIALVAAIPSSCWLSRLNIMWIMIRDWILP